MLRLIYSFFILLFFLTTAHAGDIEPFGLDSDPFESCIANEIAKSQKKVLGYRFGGISREEAIKRCNNKQNGFNDSVDATAAESKGFAGGFSNGNQHGVGPGRVIVDVDDTIFTRKPMFNLSTLSFSEMASILEDSDLKMYTVQLTTSAVIGSLLITGYRLLALGGRQKALAALIPPGVLNEAVGRSGYRVPPHNEYDLEDVTDLAIEITSLTSEEDIREFLITQDPELVAYFSIIVDYVRQAQAIENDPCFNSELCA